MSKQAIPDIKDPTPSEVSSFLNMEIISDSELTETLQFIFPLVEKPKLQISLLMSIKSAGSSISSPEREKLLEKIKGTAIDLDVFEGFNQESWEKNETIVLVGEAMTLHFFRDFPGIVVAHFAPRSSLSIEEVEEEGLNTLNILAMARTDLRKLKKLVTLERVSLPEKIIGFKTNLRMLNALKRLGISREVLQVPSKDNPASSDIMPIINTQELLNSKIG